MFAVVLLVGGVIQNFHGYDTVTTLAGGQQTLTGGPVASQEAIKELGTNGGGFYNANSAHPFENPTKWTNLVEIFLLLMIPFSLPRTFGKLVGDVRQGYAILAAMATIWVVSVIGITAFETAHHGSALQAAGAAMEGKEARFGVPASSLFAASTTLTSTGAVDSFHDSFTPLGGGITIFDMLTGEVAPGGVGSGLYGILVLAVVAVFVAGLMVGRTPEYLGKKIQAREMKLRQPVHPGHPGLRADRHRDRHGAAGGAGGDAQRRPARPVRGAVRLHLGEQQQRLGVRRSGREHRLVQHRAGPGDAAGPVPADDLRPRVWPGPWPGSSRCR